MILSKIFEIYKSETRGTINKMRSLTFLHFCLYTLLRKKWNIYKQFITHCWCMPITITLRPDKRKVGKKSKSGKSPTFVNRLFQGFMFFVRSWSQTSSCILGNVCTTHPTPTFQPCHASLRVICNRRGAEPGFQ